MTRAGVLDHVAGAAGGADLADDGEDHVLGRAAQRQLALDVDPHRLRALLHQRLRRQHVLDLGRADAEGEGAEGAVRAGVAVAADDRGARQGEALLGADDVDDALADVAHAEQRDAELRAVPVQGLDLDARGLVLDRPRAVGRRDVVVRDGQRQVGPAHLAAGGAQPLEGLRARHLVDEVAVDVEEAGAAGRLLDQVAVPDLLEEGASARRHVLLPVIRCLET